MIEPKLTDLKVIQLRELAKQLGITYFAQLKKDALIARIEEAQKRQAKEKETVGKTKKTAKKPIRKLKKAEITKETEQQLEPDVAENVPEQSEQPKEETPVMTASETLDEPETEKEPSRNAQRDIDKKTDVAGILDLHPDGYGFLRSAHYYSGENDTYVPPQQVRRFRLRTGDYIEGITRDKTTEKFNALIYVKTVNGETPDKLWGRKEFDDFTPIYPDTRINLEHDPNILAPRLVDLIAPIGKGQRGLIVSPPKAGKTTMLKQIANAIAINHPDIEIIVLLIDERPEEVTDIRRSVKGDVIASTFDELPQNHVRISEIVLERAKRLVEHGKDVVILLDSITRLTRAYNLFQPPSGKLLSGGIDASAFHKPKRFFGAARNIENGGSLTILATALVDTGSRMDDVVYEEFKGTGNMELHLDRNIANLRIFPAIHILNSGTRREETLLTSDEFDAMVMIRRLMQRDHDNQLLDKMYESMRKTDTNDNFIRLMIESMGNNGDS